MKLPDINIYVYTALDCPIVSPKIKSMPDKVNGYPSAIVVPSAQAPTSATISISPIATPISVQELCTPFDFCLLDSSFVRKSASLKGFSEASRDRLNVSHSSGKWSPAEDLRYSCSPLNFKYRLFALQIRRTSITMIVVRKAGILYRMFPSMKTNGIAANEASCRKILPVSFLMRENRRFETRKMSGRSHPSRHSPGSRNHPDSGPERNPDAGRLADGQINRRAKSDWNISEEH